MGVCGCVGICGCEGMCGCEGGWGGVVWGGVGWVVWGSVLETTLLQFPGHLFLLEQPHLIELLFGKGFCAHCLAMWCLPARSTYNLHVVSWVLLLSLQPGFVH